MRDYRGKNNPSFKHGLTKTLLYGTWSRLKSRCTNQKHQDYHHYGGRGITICDDWKENFQAFYDWSITNGYRKGLTIDRINNDKGYCPENCRWATVKEQSNNRRSNTCLEFRGEVKTISQWADAIGVDQDTICKRLKNGWDMDKTLTTPTRIYKKKIIKESK